MPRLEAGNSVVRWAAGAAAAAGIAAAGRWKRALSPDGALAATLVGTVTLARGGLPASAALVTFFVTSSALSRFKEREKARRGVLAQAKGGERDSLQVLANGGVAAACLLLPEPARSGGFLGALATAGADTWATELGLLARSNPRLVTTREPVQPGTSGGVTPEGTLAALGGGLVVGAAWAALAGLPSGRWSLVPLGLAGMAGVAGALADSALGATVQAAYWCPRCDEPTEAAVHARCGGRADHVRGWRWMTNDAVNLSATLCGALIGTAMAAGSRAAWSGDRSP